MEGLKVPLDIVGRVQYFTFFWERDLDRFLAQVDKVIDKLVIFSFVTESISLLKYSEEVEEINESVSEYG